MLYVGLDRHENTSTVHILREDQAKGKTFTLRGHWRNMIAHVRALRHREQQEMTVCFEASCGYGVVHEELAAFARVIVAHPGRLRLIFRAKRKNDRVDAEKLALLARLDQVPAVHVPAMEVRSWRELIEARQAEIRARVAIKNQIRALLRTYGMTVPAEAGGPRSLWTRKGLAWLAEHVWPTKVAAMRRDLLLEKLRHSDTLVARITGQLDELARDHAGVRLLQTIPGVGPRTAETFAAYVDDPQRFARNNRIGAYIGLVPSQDASADSNRLGHITREGPATLRKMLAESAWRCVDRCPAMRQRFEHIVAGKRERRKIALIAIAHKLARIMLAMLRSGEVWSPDRIPSPPSKEPVFAADQATVSAGRERIKAAA